MRTDALTRCARAIALVIFAFAMFVTRNANADDVSAFAKVIVDEVDLRTGPGVSFRVITTAKRGDTFALEARPSTGYWLKVFMEDGRVAYVIGDAVEPYDIKEGDDRAPSRPGLFAPPPLEGARGGLAIVGGVLRIPTRANGNDAFGFMEARPSLVLHKTFSLDAFVGDSLTADGMQLFYGAGATVYLFPSWVICPFLNIGGGGLSVFPNSDSFVLRREDVLLARAGGGFLFALRNRILVRLEASNLTLFTADSNKNAQTFAGGLGVYF